MRSWILRAALALPLALPVAVAQKKLGGGGGFVLPGEDPPAVAEAKVPTGADFSEGLKQLAALGLPDMKDAQWVKVPDNLEDEGPLFTQSYHFRETNLKLKGGVWKLAGEPPRYIDFGSSEPVAPPEAGKEGGDAEGGAVEPGKPNLLQRMLRNHAAKNPPKPSENKPALPPEEADAKAIAEALGKEELRKEIGERQEYSPSPLPGRCLIFAAQLHAAGKTAAANQVAAAVFSLPIDKEKLIDGAVSEFAATAYAAVAKAFFENHDWVKYRDGVKAVLEKYPRGWDSAGGVAILLPLLEKRAAGQRPAAPAIEGIELKPEALAALEQLLEPAAKDEKGGDDEALARSHGIDLSEVPAAQRGRLLAMLRQHGMGNSDESVSGLWLLEEDGEDAEPGSNPISRLQAMKMDGLIALAAVAADDTLVPVRQGGSREHSYFGGHQSTEELARSSYDSLDRPKTRGEIAMEWLEAALPEDDNRESDAATMALAAVEFWKEHRNDPPVKLALFYLNSSDRSKRSEAASYLAGHEDPEAHAAFEKAVLDSGEPVEFAQEVSSYVEQRKKAARPFLEAYSKELRTALEGVDLQNMQYSGSSYVIRSAGGVDKFLKPLALKVGAVALDEVVAAAMKSGKPEEIAGLSESVASSSMPDCLKVLGKAAEKAKPAQMVALCQVLVRRSYRDRTDMRGEGPDEDEDADKEKKEAPAKPDFPEEVLSIWRTLLSRTDELPESKKQSDYLANWTKGYGGKNCGDTALLTLELCAFPDLGQAFNPYANIHGSYEAVLPFVRKRVEAWMSGKDAPPWPSADTVSEERKKEITDKLAQLPANDIIPYAKSLPDDERMALVEIVGGYDEETPAPAGLLELKTKIVDLKPMNSLTKHDPVLLEKLGIRTETAVNYDMLKALTEKLATEAKDSSGTSVNFGAGSMGLGCVASAYRSTDPTDAVNNFNYGAPVSQWFRTYENPEALAMLSMNGLAEFWALKEGKAEKLENKRRTTQDLPTALAAKTGMLQPLMIQVLTREDAEKINNHRNEESEPEEEE